MSCVCVCRRVDRALCVSHVVVDVIDDRVCARRTIVRVRVSERAYAARVCASFVDEHDDRVDASSRFGARRRRSRVVDCTFHVVDACILMCHIDAMHHNRANDEYLHKTREFMHKTRQNTRATCTFRVLRV
jgi:hypothetical protein